ncbi:sarcosine oxidase subunit beta [Virgibacillus pantothenticus]|uniref:NAD(P)/FAD-dependent oxidoreductase n=1 Tax=Virgibacillus TaxID=84406 RepID=UPI00090A4EB4|nr:MULTISPECIES: FAD-dependent oxidoreductase [Virgibacillus]API90971.1 glycine oxidase [Virgibacillus sp. 6R]MBS7428951.1 FAD-binding oxidoreductase [Virgibacillus sp. 19R1-5]MBU8566704.1 FAD-binding oxidoreductase [Virgibacillus pantothenticus]MBU8600287.1 FAD-binding oxidoreductase [Virgibacillus pantothenticus]MBU8634860.1 FAD-binding oxidoreductase [Virgibacillus pantothenticus]
MERTTHCDVIVIGGGIIGAAIAYYSAKAGLDITVLEKDELASGTSSRCDGNILAIDKDPGFDSQMSLKSQQLVHELAQELEVPFEYRNPGSILVCENEQELEAAQQWVNQQRKAGLDFHMLDRNDLKNESAYFADDLSGGLECKTDSTVNPYMLTYSLFYSAKQLGAKVHTHTEVVQIIQDEKRQFIIQTTVGKYTANKVVNACGVWAPIIGDMLGVNIPIHPKKGQLIVASRQQPVGLRKVMEFGYLISKFGGKRQVDNLTERYGIALVFEPTESQNFLIGSSRQFAGFNHKVNHEISQHIAKRAIRFYPKMADMLVVRTYAGLRPWTEDHLPIVSSVEEVPGFYIAAGHEGDGISLAAITGKVMAEMLAGEETSIPMKALRYERFKERKGRELSEIQ